ncbi:MAG: RNA ligase family protein [Halobacteriales archaeon]
MQPLPPLPALADAEMTGHLWVQELVVGHPLRFQLDDSGRIVFADAERELPEPPPSSLRATVRHVRERFDRQAIEAAASDTSAVAFYGVATRFEGVPYDFERLPPFLGTDVHDGDDYLPPDRVEQVFDGLGLHPVNAVEKELDARYTDPAAIETPDSAWYDGPAAGVVVRNKRGDRAARSDEAASREVEPLPSAPAAAAAAAVTSRRVRLAASMARGEAPEFDPVYERVLELVYREEHARLPGDLDDRAFRTAVAERVGELR